MGKIIQEDHGRSRGRGKNWPSIPQGLFQFSPATDSTMIVCVHCKSPTGGLRYIHKTDTFEHRNRESCQVRTTMKTKS